MRRTDISRSYAPRLAGWLLVLSLLAGCTVQPEPTLVIQESPAAVAYPTAVALVTETRPAATQARLPAASTSALAAPTSTPEPTQEPVIKLAVIGDFGLAGQPEADVANLVLSWQPDYILTTGDNNYPNGEENTIDINIGQYYHAYIAPYTGDFGSAADQNRFFPSLGNHDWQSPNAQPYLDYFSLPGNERYYDMPLGPVHIFAVDSDSREPDGVGRSSIQAAWLQAALAASSAPWKIVIMHHPAYSSGQHGPVDWMRWPFKEWGASAVLAGHDHVYERLLVDDLPYFTNGLGGGPIYSFIVIDPNSQVRYNNDYGAMLITARQNNIAFEFFTRQGELIDSYTLSK